MRLTAVATTTTIAPAICLGRQQDAESKRQPNVVWQNVQDWGVEGRGFDDTANFYDRLPARAQKAVRSQVWELSRRSAGMLTRFKTDSKAIHVRYRLTNAQLALPHMPATSVSGLDLYAKDGQGSWRWAAVIKPDRQDIQRQMINNIDPLDDGQPREFTLYLPLFNGVDSLHVGLLDGAKFEPITPRQQIPIVFYGTSIMNGACASRSGMSITAILERRMNTPMVNLGFSGNGRMEAEVGQFLCELDPSIYVIDCLPNMNAKLVAERCRPLVDQLRAARPETPVLLVEDRVNTGAWLKKRGRDGHRRNQAALRDSFEKMIADGMQKIYYLPGDKLLGDDNEAATDGSHPSDLGMVRYADAYEPVLRQILATDD